MDDKRKPYATISIRKPRVSLLVSAFIMFAIAAVATSGYLQERDQLAAELKSFEDSLGIAQSNLRQAEADLSAVEEKLTAAESKLAEYQAAYAEPVGYYDYSEGTGKSLRLFSCSPVVMDSHISRDSNSAILVAYNLLDRKATADLTRNDHYVAVGEYDWSPRGDEFETIFFYMRQDLRDAFTWRDNEDWSLVHRNWEDYLEDYCIMQ